MHLLKRSCVWRENGLDPFNLHKTQRASCGMNDTVELEPCFLCGQKGHVKLAQYNEPLPRENDFGSKDYYRELWKCQGCGLILNKHAIDLPPVYESVYREASYGGDRIRERFDKVMSLPSDQSDNRGRVKRVVEYFEKNSPDCEKIVLDIGSGMAVFPAAMKENGFRAVCVDPDEKNVEHARDVACVEAIHGSFPDVEINERFPLITLNKVLEHLPNPIEVLKATRELLAADGVLHLELPDGEAALNVGPGRQEFFLEHYHIYSAASISLLALKAGFRIEKLERLRDPSGKFSLYAFMRVPQVVPHEVVGF